MSASVFWARQGAARFVQQRGEILVTLGSTRTAVLLDLFQCLNVTADILQAVVDLPVQLFQADIEMMGKGRTLHGCLPGLRRQTGFFDGSLQKPYLLRTAGLFCEKPVFSKSYSIYMLPVKIRR